MSLLPLTTAQIRDQIISDVETKIGQAIPLLPKAFVRVLAAAYAGAIVLLYKYAGFIFLQLFVATASDQPTTVLGRIVTPLHEWGKLVGVGLPTAATPAELDLTATAEAAGPAIPSGTQFVGLLNGYTYLSTASVPVAGAGPITIPVVASADQSGNAGVGTAGNLNPGDTVSFATPVGHVQQDTVVDSQTVTAADAESSDNYRQRVIDRFQKRPQGGAPADYEAWAEEVEGIITSYPYAGNPGEVNVYCEATVASSGSDDGFPTPSQLTAVEASIKLDEDGRATRKQVNAFVRALSITRKEFRVTVVQLQAEDSTQVESDITDALDATMRSFEPLIDGLTVTQRDRILRDEIGGVVQNVVQAAGATYTAVLLETQPILPGTFSGKTVATDDDAEETSGTVVVGGIAVTLGGSAQLVGLRFPGINIPKGSTITSATLTLEASATNDTYSDFTIRGEASANAAAYTTGASNISLRPQTVAFTSWIPAKWTIDTTDVSPDVSAQVQEVIDIAAWATSNPVAFVITGTDDSARTVKTFDAGLGVAPILSITYTTESPAFSSVQIYTLREGEKARLGTVTFS